MQKAGIPQFFLIDLFSIFYKIPLTFRHRKKKSKAMLEADIIIQILTKTLCQKY